tara:strand:- start:1713 stop:2147 length:435 start_codon:yes stop_codon:yes gene_type:complete
MGHKGHWGEYTGNAKWSKDHAHTKVTKENYKATEKDDAAHIDYLKRDIKYDNKHGHSDENMTADEKHISKLAGDMKYDKEHHGSPAKKNKKLKAGKNTNYNRRDKDSYFYDEDYAQDAGPVSTEEELKEQRKAAIEAARNMNRE